MSEFSLSWWVPKDRIENWIRFRCLAEEHVVDRQRSCRLVRTGSIFAFVRWISNDYGAVVSRHPAGRRAGERYYPYMRPAGESPLRLAKCRKGPAGNRRPRGARHRSS